MKRKQLVMLGLSLFLLSCSDSGTNSTPTKLDYSFEGTVGDGKVNDYTQDLVTHRGLVGLTGVSIQHGSIGEVTYGGLTKRSSSSTIKGDESWQIGSLTKSFTALLAGIAVEEGKLSWDLTMAEAFPDQTTSMHTNYKEITIVDLLSNSSGLNAEIDRIASVDGLFSDTNSIRTRRSSFSQKGLSLSPTVAKGTYEYNNIGFVIVASILENLYNKTWEELITEKIFNPLQIASGGFGPPGSADPSKAVWGHATDGIQWQSLDPTSKYSDNPDVLGPAGSIHLSIQDMAKYLIEHEKGHRGEGVLAKKETYIKLHTGVVVEDEDEPNILYALGWTQDGSSINHDGITPGFSAMAMIDFDLQYAACAITNTGEYRSANLALLDLFLGLAKRIQNK